MAKARVNSAINSPPFTPSLDPEIRAKQMVGLAVDLAEKQLIEGTASPSIIAHYLKLGSRETELKNRELERNVRLLEVKANQINETTVNNELYRKVLSALSSYRGEDDEI